MISDGTNTILETGGLHQFLVLVTTNGSEHICDTGRDKRRDREIQFLDGGQNDPTDDDRQTQPLGLGDLLSVDKLGQHSSKGRLRSLDNLGKGNRTHSHGKDGGAVGTHETEGNRKHFLNVVKGNLGLGTSVRGQPKEESVKAANSQLQTRNEHGETSFSTRSIQGKLVGDVVLDTFRRLESTNFSNEVVNFFRFHESITYIVVSKVPKEKVGQKTEVNASLGSFLSSTNLEGVIGRFAQGLYQKGVNVRTLFFVFGIRDS